MFTCLAKYQGQELAGSGVPLHVTHGTHKLSTSAKYTLHFMNLLKSANPRRGKREEEAR